MKRTAVIGIGNILRKDDGLGVRAAEALLRGALPAGVEVLVGGTDCFGLDEPVLTAKRVIIIDACYGGRQPGTVYRFVPGSRASPGLLSLHDFSLLDWLSCLLPAEQRAELVVVGAEPKDTGFGLELSPELARALPRVVQRVRVEIGRTCPGSARQNRHN